MLVKEANRMTNFVFQYIVSATRTTNAATRELHFMCSVTWRTYTCISNTLTPGNLSKY